MRVLHTSNKIKIISSSLVALILFTSAFSRPLLNFWIQLPISVLLLCAIAVSFERTSMTKQLRSQLRDKPLFVVLGGMLSAVLLYIVFYVGNAAASWLQMGIDDIANVYTLKKSTSPWLIAAVIIFIVGPGEEFFWRFFIQGTMEKEMGIWCIPAASLIYSLVHLPTGNMMLIAASLICGLFWGYLYWKYKNIYMNMLSHVLWDLAVFILFPFA
ncbi:hypothetical protein BVX97_03735 [bacterium E08(2017)]|nr:hypothetical protein BVX97_03735 [bacterium E08(2017)]